MKKIAIIIGSLFIFGTVSAQKAGYWQQQVDYKMNVSMDVKNYQYKGKQELVYTNNSPDTLKKVFYHLYNNAFQPNTEMDMRLRTIKDPDKRMVTKSTVDGKEIKESRLKNLKKEEIGYLHVSNFKQNGIDIKVNEIETVLEVILSQPLLPGSKTTFTLDFEGQVPVQIRRSGRNNAENIELSMAQWYPKLAEYDEEGWHADAYIGREFHGVWGNFDVSITIDKEYVLGGTGYLQNKNEIGHGYQDQGIVINYPKKAKTLTWHFVAPMVHDFTWAADKNYLHETFQIPDGATLHFLYKNNPKIIENWKKLQPKTAELMKFYNKTIGKYPYQQYSVIQGGDGGMEYAMCTLILGEGNFDGLLGVTAHEMAHSWFQHVLASNESKHSWMDEGFTSYLEDLGMDAILNKHADNPFLDNYNGYIAMANSGKEQSQGTHSDRYDENRTYGLSSYCKGCTFVAQLQYLIGKPLLDKTMKRYFQEFKFKHPTPNDFKRIAEKVSGAVLDWYLIDWTLTTNTIDYSIKEVIENKSETQIKLERIGRMPMPIDLLVEYTDGTKESFYIPLRMMYFQKENPYPTISRTVLNDWTWGNPNFEFTIKKTKSSIKSITIDPYQQMADVKKENNTFKN